MLAISEDGVDYRLRANFSCKLPREFSRERRAESFIARHYFAALFLK